MPKRKKQSVADKLSIAGIVVVSGVLAVFWLVSLLTGAMKIIRYSLGYAYNFEAMPIMLVAVFCTLFWGLFVAWCFEDE